MNVKPRGDLKVWDPELKQYLASDGREVADDDLYWNRLLADQDVERVTQLPIGSGNTRRPTDSTAGAAGSTGGDAA